MKIEQESDLAIMARQDGEIRALRKRVAALEGIEKRLIGESTELHQTVTIQQNRIDDLMAEILG